MGDDDIRDVGDLADDSPGSSQAAAAADQAGVPWGGIIFLLGAVVLVVFSVQNSDDTQVSFLGWAWTMPLALLVLVTALVTVVLTAAANAFYRRRRRLRRREREERRSAD